MGKELNYIGKVEISGMEFSYVNVSFSMKQISTSADNLYGGKMQKRKGWRKFCTVDIYITNKSGESGDLQQLITNLKSLYIDATYLHIKGYSEDGLSIIFNHTFDILESEINYSDYLVGNSKIGLKFSFSVSQSRILSSLIPSWEDTFNPYVLSDDILIEQYIASAGEA